MRGAWFLGFFCATLALTSASSSRYTRQVEEPICLAYVTDTLTNAMRHIHAHYSGKSMGQSDRVYQEGTVQYAPGTTGDQYSTSGITSLRKVTDQVNTNKRTRRSPGYTASQPLKPIDMDFGDMSISYGGSSFKKDEVKASETARQISCTEYTGDESVTVDLAEYLDTMLGVKDFFDKLFVR